MKQFFKFMFASMVGFLLTLVVVFFLLVGLVAGIASMASKPAVTLSSGTILHLQLNTDIPDRTSEMSLENIDLSTFSVSNTVGLDKILESIERAEKDDNIKGIYLDVSFLPAGLATIEEIRQALLAFKSSGKFIYSYSELYTQKAYYLASVSDKIYLNPEGTIDFRGLSSTAIFFKQALAKLEIEAQIIRGSNNKFKSAVEPFFLDQMSPESKDQTHVLLTSVWWEMLAKISKQRGMSKDVLYSIAENYLVQEAADAQKLHLVDSVVYKDQFVAIVNKKIGKPTEQEIKLVSLQDYVKMPNSTMTAENRKNKIAIIYASGEIQQDKSSQSVIDPENFSKALREARTDSTIKAVVLRINSPGGSVIASETIRREVYLTKKVKPLIVSMGNAAASGGYWIATPADRIFANAYTITGSIGVFGIIPNIKGFLNNKLGVTVDQVKTNTYADMETLTRPLTESEKRIIQQSVDRIYGHFIHHVSSSRHIPLPVVDSIGQGRVWCGAHALNNKLVDEIGGLQQAIDYAAKKAGISKAYRTVAYPKEKDMFTQLMEGFQSKISASMLKAQLGEEYIYYQQFNELRHRNGIMVLMPYQLQID